MGEGDAHVHLGMHGKKKASHRSMYACAATVTEEDGESE